MKKRYETSVYRLSLANWRWVVYSVTDIESHLLSCIVIPVAEGRRFTEAGAWAAAREVELQLIRDDYELEDEIEIRNRNGDYGDPL